MLTATTASADNFRYAADHVTSKSPAQVWKVMSAYRDTCDKGCKYGRPNLVVVKKLSYQATASSWYTWSHVSSLKDVKFFTKVTFKQKADGHFTMNNRQLTERDASTIKALEAKTGLEHSPAFDAGNTRTITSTVAGGKTKVSQLVTLEASGVVALWPSKVRTGMRKSVDQTFKNIGK